MSSNIMLESVGSSFNDFDLQNARDKTLEVILRSAKQIVPGMIEKEAKQIIVNIQKSLGAPTSWHPPQIRFGSNTLLTFGRAGEEPKILQENDIYFIDIGPIFKGHEGDVGRTFYVGHNPLHEKCCKDVEAIWNQVYRHWKNHNISGKELYEFADQQAKEFGWILSLENANGHRIADFPHAAKMRSSIESLVTTPKSNRWILEIQIKHPSESFGAFYEDLLT